MSHIHLQIIRENWNLKYSACFVLCPVTAPGLAVPYSVSVVSKIRTPPGNIVLVRNTDEDADLINTTHINNIPDKIGVCVKPLHFDYDSVCDEMREDQAHVVNLVIFRFRFDLAGIASIGISGDELIARRITFHLLQSHAGTARIVRAQALHEWRLELERRQCNATCIDKCGPYKGIGEHVAMGFTDAIAKGHPNRRTVCCTQRLSVPKHVSVRPILNFILGNFD